jgi:hypothetical protein
VLLSVAPRAGAIPVRIAAQQLNALAPSSPIHAHIGTVPWMPRSPGYTLTLGEDRTGAEEAAHDHQPGPVRPALHRPPIRLGTAARRTADVGWGNNELDPADKPNTDSIDIHERQWLVDHDCIQGTIMILGLSAPGFGITVTPIDPAASLSKYQQFLAHISFPTDLGNPNTWFDAATALP